MGKHLLFWRRSDRETKGLRVKNQSFNILFNKVKNERGIKANNGRRIEVKKQGRKFLVSTEPVLFATGCLWKHREKVHKLLNMDIDARRKKMIATCVSKSLKTEINFSLTYLWRLASLNSQKKKIPVQWLSQILCL